MEHESSQLEHQAPAYDRASLGDACLRERASRRLSRREVAAETGLSFRTVERIEDGKPALLESAAKLVAFFGLSLDAFMPRAAGEAA